MKTYSLLKFLSEPIDIIIDNDEEYCYTSLQSKKNVPDRVYNTIAKITIPIIQRDYAQGRPENEPLREEFIASLFFHIENRKELKLDFVYGTLQTTKETIFLPLDGQQRLTTLYLLHWFIIKKELDESSEQYESLVEFISKFSYETRDTSRRFFTELVQFKFKDNVVEEIQSSYWFNDHFRLDPTISSILNSLQSIEHAYNNSPKKGALLSSLLADIIVFYVLPMDQFRLTDDLYIKLNARGKVLSSFENFKADFIGFIKNDLSLQRIKELQVGINLPHYDIIANKFDNDWSNLFWSKIKQSIRNATNTENKSTKSIDAYFFRFIHRLLINNYIITYSGNDLYNDSIYKQLLNKEATLQYSSLEFYIKNRLITTESIKELEGLLDFYLKHYTTIRKCRAPLWESSLNWSIFKESYIMDDRMIYDAVNMYILNNLDVPFNEERFKEWMRLVWNIISDPDIRSIEANKAAMGVIRTLSIYSGNINANLVSGNVDDFISSLKNIHKGQLEEEKLKAVLMSRELVGQKWRDEIFKAEAHPLFMGNISFLLQNASTPEHLEHRINLAKQLFGERKPIELLKKEHHSLIRYIISRFTSWDELAKFNFTDNEVNWRTYLRRNANVKSLILELLSLESIIAITNKLKMNLANSSVLQAANTKQLNAHKNLYSDNAFHFWMQSDGVNKVKWIDSRIYAIRPSAWYSKIMIDGYRNEVAQSLIKELELKDINNRCGDSNYFKGETYDLFATFDTMKITFHFDRHNKLHIGLWGELNPELSSTLSITDGWIEIHSFDLDDIKKNIDVEGFIIKIRDTIVKDEKSRIKKLFKNISVSKIEVPETENTSVTN